MFKRCLLLRDFYDILELGKTNTVHEMARDEARHGKAFEGLLKRYFNK